MAHEHDKDTRRSFGDKLDSMVGHRGEHPLERAARIGGPKAGYAAQGDAASPEEEQFIAAPARQVSNTGKVRK